MTGLIAMGVLAQDAADALVQHVLAFRSIGKQGIQGGVEAFPATQQGLHAGQVVRHEEAVMPGCSLGIVAGAAELVEGFRPVSVGVLAAHKTGGGVEEGPVAEGAGVIFRRDISVAQGFRHAGNAPVVIAELQGLGHGFYLHVGRDVAVGIVEFGGVGVVLVGRDNHGLQGLLAVEIADAAEPGVGYHGNAVVAYHAAGFVTGQRPDGKLPPAVVVVQHTAHHIGHHGGV